MNIAELFVRLSADTTGLKKGMSSAATSMDALKSAALKLGGVLGAAALFRGIIKNSVEAQASLAQLQARVESTGGAAGRSVAQLTAHASALQSITTFGDEAVMSAQALLLTFKKIRGGEFDRATAATLDLATAMGGDLKGAALQLGKALEDPVRGLTALRRSGVSFTEAQQDVIAKLVETGKVAEAQNLILAEMETQFGGAAKAARNTLGGALQGLSNAWGDALEVSGAASAGIVGAINSLGEAIPAVRQRINAFFTLIQELATNAAVNVERLRVGWIKWQIALTKATGEGAPGELDRLKASLLGAQQHLGFMETAAVELMAELYKVPPPLAAINTHLDGLEEAVTGIGHSMSDFVAANGMMRTAVTTTMGEMELPVVELMRATEGAGRSMIQLGDALASTAVRGVDDFAAFAVGAGGSISDFVKGALQDLSRLLVKLAVVGALKAAINFGTFGSGAFAHGFLGMLEGRASGGPVRGGQSYVVGERGPEIFTPSGSGTITPNGGGAAIVLPAMPRPMSPSEAAMQAWFIEAIRIVTRSNVERG